MAQTVIQQKYTNLHSDLPLHSRSWFHDGGWLQDQAQFKMGSVWPIPTGRATQCEE